ncbi:MAG: hypothetical protein GY953_13615, partial [bacterium]|nr:hypothetical protein [bacterium]
VQGGGRPQGNPGAEGVQRPGQRPSGGGGMMMIFFPGAADGGLQIGPKDKSVEVEMKTRTSTVRQRFRLDKMQYNGKLEI